MARKRIRTGLGDNGGSGGREREVVVVVVYRTRTVRLAMAAERIQWCLLWTFGLYHMEFARRFADAFRAGIGSAGALVMLASGRVFCWQPTVGGSCEVVAARLPVALRVATWETD